MAHGARVLTVSHENVAVNVEVSVSDGSRVAVEGRDTRWYVAYTSANQEKRVSERLGQRGMERLVPTYLTVRRWKNRQVTLQRPLFPGYVFVRMDLRDRLVVLQVPGVARLVGFGGTPTTLTDEEVERLARALGEGRHPEPHPFLAVGRRVRVKRGPLAGLHGILKRRGKHSRLVLSVELIRRSVAVEIEEGDLEIAT